MTSPLDLVLYVGVPYAAFVVMVGGLLYRFRGDGIAWGLTARASGFFGDRTMGIAALAFHGGLFVVLGGHVLGILGAWFGVSELVERFAILGTLGGFLALFGACLALYRRFASPRLRAMSRPQDYLIQALLVLIFVTGLYEEVFGVFGLVRTVGKWFVSLFLLSPNVALIANAPPAMRVHVLLTMVFWAVLPFTKLAHFLTVPVGYLVRPYISVRRHEPAAETSEP